MRKIITIAIILSLTACTNEKSTPVNFSGTSEQKTRIDSSYATYSLGNSIETYTTKVYVLYKDTSLMKQVDSLTLKKIDTTLKIYFIPRVDTLFQDQAKRQNPLLDNLKKTRTTIVWIPLDERLVLMDFKKKK